VTQVALSCVFPPSLESVEYARVAEDLGYERCWLYDSPALYGDIWIGLARIADATSAIGLGAGVAIPSLRHPMVVAAAIADIELAAPGRLIAAFGTGFTGRLTMGQKAMKWSDLALYVEQVGALLGGETVEIDGGQAQMLHMDGWAPARPIATPLLVAPSGPKGFATAKSLHVPGVVVVAPPSPDVRDPAWDRCGLLMSGTVLDDGEDHNSKRVIDALGPHYTTGYHGLWEYAPAMLSDMPGGAEWLARIDSERDEGERHLAVHQGHLSAITERDRPLLQEAGERILSVGWTGTADQIRKHLDEVGEAGVTEILYMACGPNIAQELERMAAAVAQTN
jgi:5,10-methylenetetrahydromethanopterin reductase